MRTILLGGGGERTTLPRDIACLCGIQQLVQCSAILDSIDVGFTVVKPSLTTCSVYFFAMIPGIGTTPAATKYGCFVLRGM